MTSELIERVARAICESYTGSDLSWRHYVAEAQVAIAAMQADAAPVAWMYERGSERKAYVERSQAALACGYAETPLYAHPPVADRVSTSSPVVAHETPETSGKLRDAVAVWRYASDAATLGSVKYKPAADEAAAAIIEQDREAVRAEQAAELAKFKALAEELAGARMPSSKSNEDIG